MEHQSENTASHNHTESALELLHQLQEDNILSEIHRDFMQTKLDTFTTYKERLEAELASCNETIDNIYMHSREVGSERAHARKHLADAAFALLKAESYSLQNRKLLWQVVAERDGAHFDTADIKAQHAEILYNIDQSLHIEQFIAKTGLPLLKVDRDIRFQGDSFGYQYGRIDSSVDGLSVGQPPFVMFDAVTTHSNRYVHRNDTYSLDLDIFAGRELYRVFDTESPPKSLTTRTALEHDKTQRTDIVVGRCAIKEYLQLYLSDPSEQAAHELDKITRGISQVTPEYIDEFGVGNFVSTHAADRLTETLSSDDVFQKLRSVYEALESLQPDDKQRVVNSLPPESQVILSQLKQ